MKPMRCRWLLPAALLSVVACHREGAPRPEPAAPATTASATPADAEGMCREHGVLEAVCTKCNPALIPVFKDKGDWCAEHDFPESFCPICHPERGGRPSADVSASAPAPRDEGPADGTRVRFLSEKTAELAGIETAAARPAVGAEGIEVPATIVADPSRVAKVNVRASGVLREVRVEVGSVVRQGDAVAVISSSEAGAARSRVAGAEARVHAARAELEREKTLREQRVSSEQDLVAAQRALAESEAELAGARAEVGVVGAIGPGGTYTLTAPRAGVVVERTASVGQLVGPEDVLFTIVDASTVWAELDVPERHLDAIDVGAAVTVGTGDRKLPTRLEFVSPVLDPHTRTARARASLVNPSGSLRINARTKAWILPRDVDASSVSVPASAVQRIGELDVVFVRRSIDNYELKRVEVVARGAEAVILTSGVATGEDVATTGSFLLKTEVLKASIGSGCCEVD